MMTPQEIFDKVARHMLTQKCKAMVEGNCMYRTPEGLRCAAGCLIPDDKYRPDMEGVLWGSSRINPLNGNRDSTEIIASEIGHRELVGQLQMIHDEVTVEDWRSAIDGIAAAYELDAKVLDEFPADITIDGPGESCPR